MLDYWSPADLLATGLHLPPVSEPSFDLPPGTTCSISGQPITRGYRVSDMVTDATAEFLDAFRGGVGGYVSESAARCIRSDNPRNGRPCARSHLIFAGDDALMPLISRAAARKLGRPCWSDLVRAVWPAQKGRTCLVIITTDTKKRLWIRARVGALGVRTPLLYHDAETGRSEVMHVSWPDVIACLDLVESIYTAGFAKPAIRGSLFSAQTAVQAAGVARTLEWERALRPWRETSEFIVATLIAQRAEEE